MWAEITGDDEIPEVMCAQEGPVGRDTSWLTVTAFNKAPQKERFSYKGRLQSPSTKPEQKVAEAEM